MGTMARGTEGTAKGERSRIPTFKNVEEEAEFWDTHDLTELEDELELVTDVKFVKTRPKKALTVRLDQDTFAAVSQEARKQGIGSSTLARLWILERVRAGVGQGH